MPDSQVPDAFMPRLLWSLCVRVVGLLYHGFVDTQVSLAFMNGSGSSSDPASSGQGHQYVHRPGLPMRVYSLSACDDGEGGKGGISCPLELGPFSP